ncbi:MAG: histidine kinase [Streptococcus sp.]|uniref:sensor histidine kinase n=1 Tax=Streptococcus sp. TaxID=1306 RepID=UPI0028FF2610|nr:histidine kinase [Streptococcus sp.]MDU2588258.1 histidine kinase [Streptococcus sp.]
MAHSFKHSLQKEILHRSSLAALATSFLLLILLFGFSYFLQKQQLTKDTQQIIQHIRDMKQANYQLLETMNQKMVPEFLEGKHTDRELFSLFYETKAQLKLSSDFIILDDTGELLFSTNRNHQETILAPYYLKLLIQNPIQGVITEKVALSIDKQHYALFIMPIVQNQRVKAYSISFVNENEFVSSIPLINSKYAITDTFGNIYSSNTNQFTQSTLEKFDEKLLQSKTHWYVENPLLIEKRKIEPIFSIYTFQSFFPIPSLLGLASVLTLCIFLLYFWQARRIAYKIATHNAGPIESLVYQLQEIPKKKDKKLILQTGDEFELIAEKITDMLQELDELHQKMLTIEKEKWIFERKMLEAQFNPHFLYNTLETIKITSMIDASITQELIQNLTRILRYSVTELEKETTIGQDLEIIEAYLKIHQIRFEHFSYQIDCSESLYSQTIPKLFLLPLVENALKYGRQYRIDLAISIQITQEQEALIFIVKDNAGGLTKQERLHILESLNSPHTQHGIVNSYKRLNNFFENVELDLGVNPQGETWVKFVTKGRTHV